MEPATIIGDAPDDVTIRKVTPDELEYWDAYVDGNEDATFFHRAGWYRVISDSFNHTPHYLQAR